MPMNRDSSMKIDSAKRGDYLVFTIEKDLNLHSDISPLREAVQKSISVGERTIALRFSPESYFSSQSVAILISCIEQVKESGGKIALLNPNHNLRHLLTIIDIDSSILTFDSEESLATLVK
jgi:anti-anti-sigma factor